MKASVLSLLMIASVSASRFGIEGGSSPQLPHNGKGPHQLPDQRPRNAATSDRRSEGGLGQRRAQMSDPRGVARGYVDMYQRAAEVFKENNERTPKMGANQHMGSLPSKALVDMPSQTSTILVKGPLPRRLESAATATVDHDAKTCLQVREEEAIGLTLLYISSVAGAIGLGYWLGTVVPRPSIHKHHEPHDAQARP
ncbi:unnamed protein product [Tilletia laevis]|uniref:Protein BIG1 n=2 Tax=Tilletia TaxID=13289 RepID=A0A9N8QDC9_9BASI|nr:hypothetical protein CF336_g5200 [Tilletia laevis]KAE8262770.1 hypothetical protein A4X03_0g2199 [Tilletia caries]KAE8197942.1 hypothetical protein CF335_g4500 [Tilletia laevis]CAD6921380.1 unnamed protein product [Tilletia laevis]CAD6939707.1 unnamed protein product [Tilletia laevis]